MRIALCVDGSRGDVHPMLELGVRLEAAGHAVVLCAPPDFAADAAARGLVLRPVGAPVRDYLTRHARAIHHSTRQVLREATRYFQTSLAAQFAVLPEATAGCDFVLAASIELAAASAAELHGVPYRYVAYCPVLLRSAEHPAFLVPTRTLPGWVNQLTWGLMGHALGLLLRGPLARERAALGLAPVRDLYRHLLGERPILAADPVLAPLPSDVPFAVQQIPCLHTTGHEPLPPKLESFLAEGPAPVYLGFGSMPDPDPAATTRLVLEAVARAGCRALIGEGWAGLGGGALPEGVMAIGTVSHGALFPRCAAVVHHGGAGTTTTAARAGVPQIVVPHAVDQFYWARRVAALGLGPPAIRRRRLSAAALAATLEAVRDNEILSDRARELGAGLLRAAQAHDPVLSIIDSPGA